jgi:ribulose-phosphate 3-epimerase
MIRESGASIHLEVDGGVDASNAGVIAKAGATVLVAGNAIFRAPNIPDAVAALRASVSR